MSGEEIIQFSRSLSNNTAFFNVLTYGATGNGVTDDTAAIASAVTAAGASKGIVFFPPGIYNILPQVHPENPNYFAGIIPDSNTSIIGSGQDATIIKLNSASHPGSVSDNVSVILNRHITAGDSSIRIGDLTIDGNAANTSGVQNGLNLLKGQGYRVYRVTAINCHGTSSSGWAETGHFIVGNISDSSFINCEARRTSGSTASGFHINASNNISFNGCIGSGMTVANGFTNNACSNLAYINCYSYLNALEGFNNEVSEDITMVGCIAGGISLSASGQFSAGQSLGNLDNGFQFNGTTLFTMTNCIASNNAGGSGMTFVNSSTGRVADSVIQQNLIGTAFDASCIGTIRMQNILFSGNTATDCALPSGFSSGPPSTPTPPSVPLSTVSITNPFPFDVTVYIQGGTFTVVKVHGDITGLTSSGTVRVPVGSTISITYTIAPSWTWFLE